MPQFDLISNIYLLTLFTTLFFIGNINYVFVVVEMFIYYAFPKLYQRHLRNIKARELYYKTAIHKQKEWELKAKVNSML